MRQVFLVFGAACLFASTAQADDSKGPSHFDTMPAGEISAAVSLQAPADLNGPPLCDDRALPCHSPKTVPDLGWTLGGARNINEIVAIEGAVGVYHNLWDSQATLHANHREDNRVYSAMIGPRIASPFRRDRYSPFSEWRAFGHVLIGAVTSDLYGAGRAIEPGVGLDVRGRSGAIFRMQLDKCLVGGAARNLTTSRAFIGLALAVGSRE